MDLIDAEKPIVYVMGATLASRLWIQALLMESYDVKMSVDLKQFMQQWDMLGKQATLILLDSQMPIATREAIFHEAKCNPAKWNTPVVLYGTPATDADELTGFEQGAADYLVMPLCPNIFKAKIHARFAQHEYSNTILLINRQLEEVVARRVADISKVQDATMMAMTALAKTRDSDTGNHICRTQHYVRALSMALQHHPRFACFLTERNIDLLFKSAPLHDIGKVGIPDRILLKPGRLDTSEMAIMQTHTTLGRDAIEYAEKLMGSGEGFLTIAKEIAYSHQEKWDGSGYPQGLVSEEIPLSARLMAVADVYDAITSPRVYKPGMPHTVAVDIIVQGKGLHFCPETVDAFLSIHGEFKAIAALYADT